jgi:hypothetical protein
MIRVSLTTAILLLGLAGGTVAQEVTQDHDLQVSIEQLRTSIGRWDVVTEFLNEDGSIARSATGTYEFTWVVPDRVVSGKSEIPELKQASGILFYVNARMRLIEMVSVGADGRLWIMTGPLGGETRTTGAVRARVEARAGIIDVEHGEANVHRARAFR